MELQYIKNNIRREHGEIVCPYNEECRCDRLECFKCGWNPKVDAERRKARIAEAYNG